MTSVPEDSAADLRQIVAELRRELATCRAERDAALAREAATAEILQIINSSPGDLAPVFDAMLEKAMRLCEATHGHVWRFDGDQLHAVAARGDPQFVEWLHEHSPVRPIPGSAAYRIAQGEPLVHLADRREEDAYRNDPVFRGLVDESGVRASVSVALRKDKTLLGMINVYRQEVRPFTDEQIMLLQNFAAQAVIAIENARLLGETREALAQQTATAEVLQVINSSPGDLAPVFDAMLHKAMQLCDAAFGALGVWRAERFEFVATHGVPSLEFFAANPMSPPGSRAGYARVARGEGYVQFADISDSEFYKAGDPMVRAAVEVGGARTTLTVPLAKDEEALGLLIFHRREVRPFSNRQIALVKNFAAQAVIAIENARLLTETREALAQQTATAEVLGIISSSPGRLEPVFESMLANAIRVCSGKFGILAFTEGDGFRGVAVHGVGDEFAAALSRLHHPPPGTGLDRMQQTRETIQIADCAAEPSYAPVRSLNPAFAEVRTALHVPMLKEGGLIGAILIYRDYVQPFAEKEIELVENFAKQAVIAIENVRLIAEIREALDQQTATAEVLQVINASPGDLAPVFEAILEKTRTLCAATLGSLFLYDGELFRAAAVHGYPEDLAERLRQGVVLSATPQLLDADVPWVHTPDLTQLDAPTARAVSGRGGVRTNLMLPLRKDGRLLGAISCNRTEVRPFTDKEITLIENFAAQAVIAMENARLLGELQGRTRDLEESLEYQTATSDVLKVISRSTFDLQPVLDTLVETAARLCDAGYGAIYRRDGEVYRIATAVAFSPGMIEATRRFRKFMEDHPFKIDRGTITGRVALEGRAVHVADTASDPEYRLGEATTLGNLHTQLGVPLLREGEPIGVIALARHRVEPFTERQIELVRTFADQAVIAIENARLFGELQARTRDLEESLEYQTAVSDVLQVISRSTFDLRPVLDTLLETAARLCNAEMGLIALREGGIYPVASSFAFSAEFNEIARKLKFEPGRGSVTGRAALERRVVYVADIAADPEYALPEVITIGKMRTALGVPLLRESEPIGVLYLARQRVEPFIDRQIELVRTFADQAVIAIENTRLLTELRESLEQQTATAEILQVINSSPGDLRPVFDAVLERAMGMCGAAFGMIHTIDGVALHLVAQQGIPPLFAEFAANPTNQPGPGGATPRLMRDPTLRFVHVFDLKEEEAYRAGDPYRRALVHIGGARTLLAIPLRKERVMAGVINVYRQEVRPYSDRQIALLENFAAQAVIAMDNARLLEEIRRRQAELRVTFDNMGDGVAMFDAELRLAAWNRNFQQMLDLPDALLAGRPSLADYIRHLAMRGEYGEVEVEAEVRRLIEAAGTQYSTERTRPDGRVIEVRANPVPGGGVVINYSDVTERKRAEAEIRAARDAAEKALGDLKTAQASLVHAEKMASLGQLTAGIAHEIKNPLNFVNNFAGLSVELLDELREASAPAVASLGSEMRAEIDEIVATLSGNLAKIGEHGRRADGIVTSMLAHSRGTTGERQRVDLNALVEEALNLAYHGARAQDQEFNIAMERAFAPGLAPIEIVPQDLTRVFLNLFGNGFYAARQHAREAGDGFRPVLAVATRELGDMVEVRVRDNGTGIPPEIRDKLFQPFFTTKPTGEGTGLGLSISWDIVTQQHGGTIMVDSEPGRFTEFTVRLPRTRHSIAAG